MKHQRPHYDNKGGKDSQPRRYNVEKFRSNYDNIFRKHFTGIGPSDLDEQRIGSVDRETGRRYMGQGASEHIVHQQP